MVSNHGEDAGLALASRRRLGASSSVAESSGDGFIGDLLARATDPKRERWEQQVARTGYCSNPIRLRGRVVAQIAGRRRQIYSTASEPDRTLLIRCGNRRASVCPSCAHEYRGDMWQLLFAGCVGGRKGVSESVRHHPLVFATLTAPSFGPAHTIRADGSCHPRGAHRCDLRHAEDDPRLGEPLDPDTYDYEAAVLFNRHAPELWRRFTIALRRELASELGVAGHQLPAVARLSFAKVAEFQRRGVVHFHAIIRLDGPAGPGDPLPAVSVDRLACLIRAAAAGVELEVARSDQSCLTLCFGEQAEIRPLSAFRDGEAIDPEAVAAYISKYATKATEDLGLTGRRIDPPAVDQLELRNHVRAMVRACVDLEAAHPGIFRWAHMLGFNGHFATKSRMFSTTLGELRQARADYRAAQDEDDIDEDAIVIGEWSFEGMGYLRRGDALLADTARRLAIDEREAGRLELARGAP